MLVAQLCPTLCNPMDWNPQGSSVHGLHQARILEWVAFSSSRGSSWPLLWSKSPFLQWKKQPQRGRGLPRVISELELAFKPQTSYILGTLSTDLVPAGLGRSRWPPLPMPWVALEPLRTGKDSPPRWLVTLEPPPPKHTQEVTGKPTASFSTCPAVSQWVFRGPGVPIAHRGILPANTCLRAPPRTRAPPQHATADSLREVTSEEMTCEQRQEFEEKHTEESFRCFRRSWKWEGPGVPKASRAGGRWGSSERVGCGLPPWRELWIHTKKDGKPAKGLRQRSHLTWLIFPEFSDRTFQKMWEPRHWLFQQKVPDCEPPTWRGGWAGGARASTHTDQTPAPHCQALCGLSAPPWSQNRQ